jgi:hypothetical protein
MAVKAEANERVSLLFPPLFVVSWNFSFGVSAIGSTDNCPAVAAKVGVTRSHLTIRRGLVHNFH